MSPSYEDGLVAGMMDFLHRMVLGRRILCD